MATATIKQTCVKCNKGGGSATCNGCQQVFCVKHFIEHRQELSQQMDNIGQEHDLLRRDLSFENNTQSLFERIEQWEHESIKTIQTLANKARTELQQLFDQTKNELKASVNKLTEDIRTCRESDDYTEIDIQKWIQQIRELRQTIENSSTINIECDSSTKSVIPLIKVSRARQSLMSYSYVKRLLERNHHTPDTVTAPVTEQFTHCYGNIARSPDDLAAWCLNTVLGGSCVCGVGRYSSKTHHIRLRIEKKNSHFLFLGIITASEISIPEMSTSPSAYGWWDLGYTIVNGKVKTKSQEKIISTGDEVVLILDCANQQIQLLHQPTKAIVDIPVDLKQCPFPWKIFFRLDTGGDRIRILQ